MRVTLVGAGRFRQLNAAASHASGDVLLFLHADVRLPADALSAIESGLRCSLIQRLYDGESTRRTAFATVPL